MPSGSSVHSMSDLMMSLYAGSDTTCVINALHEQIHSRHRKVNTTL